MPGVSSTVDEFLTLLDTYAPDGLRERAGMAALLQRAYDTGQTARIGELAFQGKYLWKLFGALQSEPADSDKYESMEREFTRSVREFQSKLAALAGPENGESAGDIRQRYLGASVSFLERIIGLAEDFNWLKNWELEMNEHDRDMEN